MKAIILTLVLILGVATIAAATPGPATSRRMTFMARYTIGEAMSPATRASLERTAIGSTLVECGLLKYTLRSVAPPLHI